MEVGRAFRGSPLFFLGRMRLLIVVEGPSAVGKTTTLRRMPPEQIVGEEIIRASSQGDPSYMEMNARRWKRFLEIEDRFGTAYADSDPLKLYYNFALASVGRLDRDVYEAEWSTSERAMLEGEVGFADRVVSLSASTEELRFASEYRARDESILCRFGENPSRNGIVV